MDRSVTGSYDLHMHSTFSDGSETAAELIDQACARGLARIAITDHDSLSQLSVIRARSRRMNFPVLAGVEVSAMDAKTGRKVHVLGYGLEVTADGAGPLERLVAETLRARTANTLWQAWAIVRSGTDHEGHMLDVDEVIQVAGGSTGVYKQHVMEALTHLPYRDAEYQWLYQILFKGSGVAARDIGYPTAVEAVRAIVGQGGTAVLAHPGQMDSWSAVPRLVDAGLAGIEAFHPDHTQADVDRARATAREFGLFVTGGSDYHGRYGAPEHVGACFVTPEEAGEAIDALFAREATLS